MTLGRSVHRVLCCIVPNKTSTKITCCQANLFTFLTLFFPLRIKYCNVKVCCQFFPSQHQFATAPHDPFQRPNNNMGSNRQPRQPAKNLRPCKFFLDVCNVENKTAEPTSLTSAYPIQFTVQTSTENITRLAELRS